MFLKCFFENELSLKKAYFSRTLIWKFGEIWWNQYCIFTWEAQIGFKKVKGGILSRLTLVIIKERLTFHITYEINKSKISPSIKLLEIIAKVKWRVGLWWCSPSSQTYILTKIKNHQFKSLLLFPLQPLLPPMVFRTTHPILLLVRI